MTGRNPQFVGFAQELGLSAFGDTIEVQRGRYTYSISVGEEHGNTPFVIFLVATPPLPVIGFRREGDYERVAKSTGLDVEVQTGDPAFDQRVYIESDAPAPSVQAALASPHARAAIVELLDGGVKLGFGDAGIRAVRSGQFDVQTLRRMLACLERVAEALPSFSAGQRAGRSFPWFGVALFGVLLSGGALTLPLIGRDLYPTLSVALPPLLGLGLGMALFLPLELGAFLKLRGRSTTLRDLAVVTVVLLEWCMPLGPCAVWLANGVLDGSPPTTRNGVSEGCSEDDDGPMGYLKLRLADGTRFRMRVSSCKGYGLHDGPLKVTTHAGALGFEWVAKAER
jgi:hypothetical protein